MTDAELRELAHDAAHGTGFPPHGENCGWCASILAALRRVRAETREEDARVADEYCLIDGDDEPVDDIPFLIRDQIRAREVGNDG